MGASPLQRAVRDGGREGGREGGVLPESNPPAGRFRTQNLFSTSGVTFPNYRLKVLPQSSHRKISAFCLSHTLSVSPCFHPSLCLLYTVYILSLPVTLPLTLSLLAFVPAQPSLSASVFLVSPSHFLSPPPPPHSVLCFSSSEYRGHHEPHITVRLKMGVLCWCLLPVHRCCQESVGFMYSSVLPPHSFFLFCQFTGLCRC